MDNKRVTLLVLLDISAAFDIPHQLFLTRIKQSYGVCGAVLDWFQSYFKGRYQRVTINGNLSDEILLEIGLAQQAGAGPFGYKVYTKPIGILIRSISLEVLYHMFADDNQLHRSFNPSSVISQTTVRSDIETCINGLSTWLHDNKLKLNESKTELLIIGKKTHLAKMKFNTLTIGDETITAVPCAKKPLCFLSTTNSQCGNKS